MPTYEFICEECNKPFALIISFSDYEKKEFRCPGCNSDKVKQQITSFQPKTSPKR